MPFSDFETIYAHNIDLVADELRKLLAQPYRLMRRNHLLGTSLLPVACVHPDLPVAATVTVCRSAENTLFLAVHDARFEVTDWAVPEGTGYCRGADDDFYFRAIDHADLEYYVCLL